MNNIYNHLTSKFIANIILQIMFLAFENSTERKLNFKHIKSSSKSRQNTKLAGV